MVLPARPCNLRKMDIPKMIRHFLILLFLWWLVLPGGAARVYGEDLAARESAGQSLKKVVVQLKWQHQFQFAGYYMAVEQGFYAKRGLEVEFLERERQGDFLNTLVHEKAQFMIGGAELFQERLKGQPLSVLAAIFQHSPTVLITAEDSGIDFPQDLIGKRVMMGRSPEVMAMFRDEGVDLDSLEILPHSHNPLEILAGNVDAMTAYMTDGLIQKFQDRLQFLRPINYGIDFYGDSIFTTEKYVRRHPDIVENFRVASLEGWQYALDFPEETVQLIHQKYAPEISLEDLRQEARATRALIQPDLVRLGHMNPNRWRRMAEVCEQLGMAPEDYSLEGFIYEHNPAPNLFPIFVTLIVLAGLVLLFSLGLIILVVFNRKMQKAVAERTRELEDLNRKLQESETRFRDLVENTEDVIWEMDENGITTYLSPAAKDVIGFKPEEMVGRIALDLVLPEKRAEVTQELSDIVAQKLPIRHFLVPFQHKNGKTVWVEVQGKPMLGPKGELWGYRGVDRDVTERVEAEAARERMQKQMEHTQRLESLGVLAGGIAHDFNNLLVGIMGNAELVAESRDPFEMNGRLGDIQKASRRAAKLCNQLLAYAGKTTLVRQEVDLAELTLEMSHILEVSVSKHVQMEYHFGKNLLMVDGDVGQLQQVVMNLITNASEAIGDQEGRISLSVENQYCDTQLLSQGALEGEVLPEGDYVCLQVRDTGCGMDPKTREHLFDPFYSTKFTGRGLGLAAVLGIVRSHHGTILVESEPGQGSCFQVYFPGRAPAVAPGSTACQEPGEKPVLHFQGVALLVDDEPVVRDVAGKMLSLMGLKVESAEDGEKGLAQFQKDPQSYLLVVLDLTMPGMDGVRLLKKMREIRPELPVLLSSGYSEKQTLQAVHAEKVAFIQKPFLYHTLQEKVAQILKPRTHP